MVQGSVTTAGKVGLLFYLVAIVFLLIGFSVPYWFVAHFSAEELRCGLRDCCYNKSETRGCLFVDTNTKHFEDLFSSTTVQKSRRGLWDCCFDKGGTTTDCHLMDTNTKHFDFGYKWLNWPSMTVPVPKPRCGLWDCCFDKGRTSDCVSIVANTIRLEDFNTADQMFQCARDVTGVCLPMFTNENFEDFIFSTTVEKLRCGLWDCCFDKGGTSDCVSIVTNTKHLEDFIFNTTVEKLRCGLWDCCTDKGGKSDCLSIVTNTKYLEDFSTTAWYCGTQALACLAVIAVIVNIAVRVHSIYGKSRRLHLVGVILDFLVGVLIFLAATVFGYYTTDLRIRLIVPVSRHFGYALYILGGIFFTGTAICFLIEFLRKK